MARKPEHPERSTGWAGDKQSEQEALLESLRAHGQVVESDDPNVPLGPGQTHVYVRKPGQASGQLIEKRKSLFRR